MRKRTRRGVLKREEPVKDRFIRIRGACEHNLKNLDIDIPRDRLVVITGMSGSGKSSLAFDTIYAEGQRRYIESLSSYARQFLEQMQKPEVESIEGLPPTISIEQRRGAANPRSTVATTTEIYDFLRLLFARAGTPYCYKCGQPIRRQSPEQIVRAVLRISEGSRVMVMAPLVRGRKGEHRDILAAARRSGYVRARIDGVITAISSAPTLDKRRKHDINVVVDRLVIRSGIDSRLSDSIETALKMGDGVVIISRESGRKWKDKLYSERYACPDCEISYQDLQPNMFSFNSPYGACPACNGLGTRLEFDPDLIVPDEEATLSDGAIDVWRRGGKRMAIHYHYVIRDFCRAFDVDPDIPLGEIDGEKRNILLYGANGRQARRFGHEFEGVIPDCVRRFKRTTSQFVKSRLHEYMSELPCPTCGGSRLRPESRAVRVGDRAIHELAGMSVAAAIDFFSALKLSREQAAIARPIIKEIRERLQFMEDVGIGYLTLDRRSGTLSGGEAQRIRLATQVGSGLVGVCYVLDEPTIGLHLRDNAKLLQTLEHLRDLGNSVLVVEHDEQTIRAADHVIDLGPAAGAHGGEIVAQGPVEEILSNERSLTASYLSGRLRIDPPEERRAVDVGYSVELRGARENNLKSINVKFPLAVFTCVTGVSGSGKSTLVGQTLLPALKRALHHSRTKPGSHRALVNWRRVDKVIEIDQSPIGRTPRSNPATYTKVLDGIRGLFAMTKDARIRGYAGGRFSFNVKGGRCEACQGQGTKCIEMHFLPDVYVTCEECKGRRYNQETLDIRFKGLNIAEVLELRADEALRLFDAFPKVRAGLQTLVDVGLGYVKLGQSSITLSGGEAQRVKLATELSKRATGSTLYVLDEPTTGLHFADIHRLLDVLNRLVDRGNTVVVIEHNPDVIMSADYIIDLGPEGGDAGGRIVAKGTPEEVAANRKSFTGRVLRKRLRARGVNVAG